MQNGVFKVKVEFNVEYYERLLEWAGINIIGGYSALIQVCGAPMKFDFQAATPNSLSDNRFRFYLTTRRLIEFSSNIRILNSDGTYKLLWIGDPVLYVGITDMDRHFYGIGLACCSREANKDYKLTFDCVAIGREMLDLPPLPKHGLMADNAESIENGWRLSKLEDGKRGNCWFHCKKAVDIDIRKITDEVKKSQIISHICFMQLAQTPDILPLESTITNEAC